MIYLCVVFALEIVFHISHLMKLHENFGVLVVEVEEFLRYRSVRGDGVYRHVVRNLDVQRACQLVVVVVDIYCRLAYCSSEAAIPISRFLSVIPYVAVFIAKEIQSRRLQLCEWLVGIDLRNVCRTVFEPHHSRSRGEMPFGFQTLYKFTCHLVLLVCCNRVCSICRRTKDTACYHEW